MGFLVFIERAYRNNLYRWRGFRFRIYLSLHGCKAGKGLKVMGRPRFREVPQGNIQIGNHCTLGRNVTFEIGPSGKVVMGDHVLLADNILLSSLSEIRIDDWAAIAENASIRGSFHQMARDTEYRKQDNDTAPIHLQRDTGIGAGTVVLMGSVVREGAFIGSNSVVTKQTEIEPYGLYAGSPAKLIRHRK